MRALSVALMLLAWLAGSEPGSAGEVGGVATSPGYAGVRAEWQAGTGRDGRPVVWGYVYNDRSLVIASVRLEVASLDAARQVLARGVEHVRPPIPPFGRTYFEVPLARAGESYRVSILSVDFDVPDREGRRRW